MELPNIATMGILASEGLGQVEGVVFIIERRKFLDIFFTSTGGEGMLQEHENDELIAYFATATFRSS